ncbi:MAG TPA: hypothetical protein VGF20_09220, partial [Candidatus Acidoferrum sp.]
MSSLVKHRRPYTQRIAACACLFALLLIYAPIATATLMTATGACCSGDYCPIHGNHHRNQEPPAQTGENAPMDCDHAGHSASKASTCSMSCCHDAQPSVATAHIFLLTPMPLSTALAPLSFAPATPAASSTS